VNPLWPTFIKTQELGLIESLFLDAPLATGYAVAGPIFMAHLEVAYVGFFTGYFIGFFIGYVIGFFIGYFIGYLTLDCIIGTLGFTIHGPLGRLDTPVNSTGYISRCKYFLECFTDLDITVACDS
jgi:hypothetical protein